MKPEHITRNTSILCCIRLNVMYNMKSGMSILFKKNPYFFEVDIIAKFIEIPMHLRDLIAILQEEKYTASTINTGCYYHRNFTTQYDIFDIFDISTILRHSTIQYDIVRHFRLLQYFVTFVYKCQTKCTNTTICSKLYSCYFYSL